MAHLVRIRDDLLISSDQISEANPQMIHVKSGIGYSIDEEIWEALCAVSLPRQRGFWARLFTRNRKDHNDD